VHYAPEAHVAPGRGGQLSILAPLAVELGTCINAIFDPSRSTTRSVVSALDDLENLDASAAYSYRSATHVCRRRAAENPAF
jgi:hypothetical protein